MRYRLPIALTAIAITVIATTLSWRRVFPFRDGLAEFLPAETIAYVHINLTPVVRRHLQFEISNLKFQRGALAVLDEVLRSPDVRELGLVWFPASTRGFGGQAAEVVPQRIVFLIGQRASSRPDAIAPASFMIGNTELRIMVIRVRDRGSFVAVRTVPEKHDREFLAPPDRYPVQMFLRPRQLPILALDAARGLLPAFLTASGVIDQRGVVARSDHRLPPLGRSRLQPLLVASRPGTLQLLRIPAREAIVAIVAPTHRELLAEIAAVLPATVDAVVSRDGFAIRLPSTDPTNERVHDAVRAVVARVLPSSRPRVLDDIPTETLVADPSSVAITPVDANRWVIRAQDHDVATIERIGDGAVIASGDVLAARDGEILRVPAGCVPNRQPALDAMLVAAIHPQLTVMFAISRDGSKFAICGGNWGS